MVAPRGAVAVGSVSSRSSFITVHQHLVKYKSANLASTSHRTKMMRIASSFSHFSTGNLNRNGETQTSKKRVGSFATNRVPFVATATATASTSYAAYCCMTALLFTSAATVRGESGDSRGKEGAFDLLKKVEDQFGIEYTGCDSYPGLHLDDGTGVATKEVKSTSAKIVSEALDAAGLDDTCLRKGIGGIDVGEDVTLHPKHVHRIGVGTCPSYGCPFLPLDVHYDEDAKAELESMRQDSGDKDPKSTTEGRKEYLLESSGKGGKGEGGAATLTLIGYKGGRIEDQVNQDRAFALTPYLYWNVKAASSEKGANDSGTRPVARLLGSFDGHAKLGEKVSEYVAKTLPALLGSKLVNAKVSNGDGATDERQRDRDIVRILRDTFLELDATAPADPSGGCTASAVLQLGTKIYVANAGDSRSFVAVHLPRRARGGAEAAATAIVYGSREDKPHLSGERERVEHMGGTVFLPNGFLETGKGTTRVMYQDPTTGSTSGLAMSRSIGDWDAGAVGVIPDPLVDILDTKEIKKRVLEKMNADCEGDSMEVDVDPTGGTSRSDPCVLYTEKDVKIFAFSATDGLLDYLPEQAIAGHVAKGLYGSEEGVSTNSQRPWHPLLVCEELIYAAADGWQKSKGATYRDDIAIAVSDLDTEQP